tara:strand:+ start:1836 stop:2408 length:573 start_codon:yes stop_codon:yes gene_type:complete
MRRKNIKERILNKTVSKWTIYYSLLFLIFILTLTLSKLITGSELTHKFKSPSFSGQGTSAHYLTIDEQERTRRQKIATDIQDALDEAEREADNTVLAKFTRNLESRIYSTLAKDIAESLFSYEGARPDINDPESWAMGSINLEGNILTWVNNGVSITLIIEEYVDGVLISTTEIEIPIGSFGGCLLDCTP